MPVRTRGEEGFTLVEVLVALGLLASAGIIATLAAAAMLRLERAAHAEAVGLATAGEKLEELIARTPAARSGGNDTTDLDGVHVTRVWRVIAGTPAVELTRLEVTARWDQPRTTALTLVAAVPGPQVLP
jgi:type II secretory pathway pseudopilin PulG